MEFESACLKLLNLSKTPEYIHRYSHIIHILKKKNHDLEVACFSNITPKIASTDAQEIDLNRYARNLK